jgi:hypothetical protein
MPGWKDKAQERVKEKMAGSTQKIEEGNNCLRIMPDKKDLIPGARLGPKGVYHPPYREFRIHRDVGPDNAMCGCGKDIEGKGRCWLCDTQIPSLEAAGIPAKHQKAQKIGPQEQFVVNASRIDPDTQKFGTAKPWWVSTGSGIPGLQSQSLAVRVFSKMSGGKRDFVDPDKGYNLNIERVGVGLKTRYPSVESDDSASKVPTSILDTVKDLDSAIPVYDEEDQKSAYFGRPRKGRGDAEEEKPKRNRREEAATDEAPRRKRPADEEEEELPADDEEELLPADDEEEAPPADDDEETPPSDEDEEEPPADDEEEEAPPPDDDEEEAPPADEDESEEEPEEEPAPPPRRAAQPARKAAAPIPAPARRAAPPAPPVKKKVAPPTKKR